MTETDWLPGLVVLGVGTVAGVGLALRARAGSRLPAPTTSHRDELLAQKEAAYALIFEHQAARASWDEADWLRERDRLEREAASVLKAIDAMGPAAPRTPEVPHPAKTGIGTRHPQLVGALWGAGVMGFVGLLALTLDQYAAPRQDGGSMTGNSGGATTDPRIAGQLDELRAAVAAAPNDLDAKNRLGHALLNADLAMEAYQLAEEVVKIDTDNAEARTHEAVVLMSIGDMSTAKKVLDRVLLAHPGFAEALGWRGAIFLQQGEGEAAATDWEAAITAEPSLEKMLRPLIASARDPNRGRPAATAGGGADAQVGASQATQAERAPDAGDVTGRIDGDTAALRPGDVLFLVARPEGVDRGPPTWARKLPITTLPMDFRIGPPDNPMGSGAAPARLVITARIDRDGNPTTRTPGDLEGKSAALAPGATGVTITLAAIGG